MRVRRATVEHPFGTLKAWMGATHFKTRPCGRISENIGQGIERSRYRGGSGEVV
jgi:hypothetical protein